MRGKRSNYIAEERLGCFVVCAVVYLLLGILSRAMGFLNLLPLAGPRNVLPMVVELAFGSAGTLGTATGALVSGQVSGASFRAVASEAVSVAAAFTFFYRSWYLIRKDGRTDLKSAGHIVQFFLTGVVAGFLIGGLEGVLLTNSYDSGFLTLCLEMGLSSLVWLPLIGMPVLVLLTSVFAIRPRVPVHLFTIGGRKEAGKLVMGISSDVQELADVGDAATLYNKQKGIPAQRGYAIMSCAEELSVLIQQRLLETGKIHICIRSDDNVVVRLQHSGERYDPFAVRVVPGGPGADLGILGILMVREMAVHVGYQRRQEENGLMMIV